MKINKLIIVLYALLGIILSSCEKSVIPYYSDENAAIKFPTEADRDLYNGYNIIDKMYYVSYSFLDNNTSDEKSIIYDIPIILIGNTSATDRDIAFSVDQEKSTAPQNSYEIIESKLPSNEYVGHIRIKLYNTKELEETSYELYLKLNNSEQLAAGPNIYIQGRISWNNQISEPISSPYVRSYNMLIKGETNYVSTSKNSYSNKAMRVIVEALDWKNWNEPEAHAGFYNKDGYKYLPNYSFMINDNSYQSYSAKVGSYIKKYNTEHPESPLIHDGGKNAGKPIESRYTY